MTQLSLLKSRLFLHVLIEELLAETTNFSKVGFTHIRKILNLTWGWSHVICLTWGWSQKETEANLLRQISYRNEFSCPVNLVTFKPTQRNIQLTEDWRTLTHDEIWEGPHARWIWVDLHIGPQSHVSNSFANWIWKQFSDSVILVWKLLQWKTFENCLTDSK